MTCNNEEGLSARKPTRNCKQTSHTMFASGEAVPSRPGPDLDENFWNFVTELDAGLQSTIPLDLPELSCILSADIQQPEQNQNAPALCPNNNQQLTAVERRQEKNRLAQKRFRQRKKVRPQYYHYATVQCSHHVCPKSLAYLFWARCGQKAKLLAQERSSTTEAQLAETTSQLHNLKLKQKELEARNALLEKLARLDKQHKIQQESPTNGCNVLLWQVTPWPMTLWPLLPAFLYCRCWLLKKQKHP